VTLPFPVTPVLDTFNRADVGPPPSASWTNDLRASGSPGLAVRSNQVKALSVGPEASAWWSAATFHDDCEAYVTCANTPPGDFEVWARGTALSGGFPQGYLAWYNAAAGEVRLQRYGPGGAGGYVSIAAAVSFILAAGDSLGVRVQGSTITAWGKHAAGSWTLLSSATDTTFATGGRVGLLMSSTVPLMDDFGGGTLPVDLPVSGTLSPAGSLAAVTTSLPKPWEPWPGCETVEFRNPAGDTIRFLMRAGVTGRMMPPVKTTMLPAPGADGSRLLGSVFLERPVVIPVVFPGQLTDRVELRQWARVLDPTQGEGVLTVVDGPNPGRFLSCVYEAGLDDLSEELPNMNLGNLIFRAARPYWTDAIEMAEGVAQGTSIAHWFPFLPLAVGLSDAFGTVDITIDGDVESWPVINVTGPGSGATALNTTTGKSWTVSGAIPAGSLLQVDTRPGVKTVYQDGLSVFSQLTTGSKLWPLAPGPNRIQLALTGTTIQSLITITWRNSWLAA
jgi:Siphovirus-type tail component, C-terminal domain